jgi:hypothetical protein
MKPESTGIWSLEMQSNNAFDIGLANELLKMYPTTNILDIGCGDGTYCDYFTMRGFSCTGIDGYDYPIKDTGWSYYKRDLTKPEHLMPELLDNRHNLALCLEVGEHIPEDLQSAFILTLGCLVKHNLVLSWAKPGQGGIGHVNERPVLYVRGLLEVAGFSFNDIKTSILRQEATIPYLKETVQCFTRQVTT